MAVIDAEGIYAAGGPNALRMAVRGGVKQRTREGRVEDVLTEIAVPVGRLAERLRANGQKAAANSMLEHAVHDGIPAAVLAEGVRLATREDFLGEVAPPPVTTGPKGELRVGPPPEAADLAGAIELANYVRNRLLTF